MLDPRVSRFWQTAVQFGLIDTEKLEACWENIPPEKRTLDAIDRRLARQAVNGGLITTWQAQQILAGRQNGLRIGRYVLLEQIGHGGMGRVYLARDTRLGRQVAIKVLSKERMHNARALARFRREGKLGAQLQHENLIRVYDEGELGGMPYLVMEYISGQTVAQLIADQKRLPVNIATELARQVALGLEHLHIKKLLHRDVNPANILVDRSGTAKLTDLGLAIDLDDEEDVVTRDGATVGTFDYISPEQARNPRNIDTRSDIYSLGCTLYHMITGQVPFPAPSLPEKLIAHQSVQAEPMSHLVDHVPEGLEAVVRKMMSKAPQQRYDRPIDAARALEPYASRGRLPALESEPEPELSLWDSAQATRGTSVAVGAKLPRGGSEQDFPVGQAATGVSGRESTSDPFGVFRLDLGPEPSLSEGLSRTRSRSSDSKLMLSPPLKAWLVGAAGVLACLLFALALGRGCEDSAPPARTGSSLPIKIQPPPPVIKDTAASSPFVVQYTTGEPQPEETLADAIRRAAGRAATILVNSSEAIEISVDRPIQVSGGAVRIRGGPDARTRLHLRYSKPTSFLQIEPNSSLELSGIAITAERSTGTNQPAAIIEAGGNLTLERCSFVAQDGGRAFRALSTHGSRVTITGCWFDGFESPLAAKLFSNSELRIQQSVLLTTDPVTDAVSMKAGWPIQVSCEVSHTGGKRRLILDHVTTVGAGLLRVSGQLQAAPLSVHVAESVVRGEALLCWAAASAFPEGLAWSGSKNRYSLLGEAWVITGGSDHAPIPNAPTQLDSWVCASITEADTSARQVTFAVEPAGAGSIPSDYAIPDLPDPKPGADPERVAAPVPSD